MKAVIIEDEPHAQEELKRLLRKVAPDLSVVTCLDSVEDSVEWLTAHEDYDLLFLDIQLSDGISFRIFQEVSVQKPVIFTTAYDEYAIQAFELNSIGYLLKPVEEMALAKALEKLRDWQAGKGQDMGLTENQLANLMKLTRPDYRTRLMVRSGDQIRHLSMVDVAYFYAEDNVVFVVTHSKKRHLVDYTLDELSRTLDPAVFFRLNRKFLAHVSAINKAQKYFNSRLKVDLNPLPDGEVLVSRARVAEFMEWMDQ